jgi:hypothetical protein
MAFGLEFLLADVMGAAVVGGEDDEGVVRRAAFFEGGEHPADDGVRFHDEIGVGAEAAFADPFLIHGQRGVRRGEGKVEQEGFGFLRRIR